MQTRLTISRPQSLILSSMKEVQVLPTSQTNDRLLLSPTLSLSKTELLKMRTRDKKKSKKAVLSGKVKRLTERMKFNKSFKRRRDRGPDGDGGAGAGGISYMAPAA
ncbi:hypothetical protein UCRPA7_8388 [Phaeoacremonium minimum UCRPA7]|uniref:Uncharacterized protein n=1 Tax=Phaeoacremonium minimum (strain UCR-PA7) TaxID=1286976 RepID=R8BA23_PHAM7|nr:hypothetical protein UCRPA7_8388 [Phaeoacremonium minimum UCRPA7]EON96126.1 hypothetical protein UCRPA7_8388 [Phaeoacremonium minimum UCRPA7]